ncbi:MAG: hypothetical protein ACO1RX_08705 [Candidatus Sericytochromatia bacterium]
MNPTLAAPWKAAENGYLTPETQQQFQAYSQSVAARLAALRDLEAHEESIARETSDLIFEVYPKVEKRLEGRHKTERDLQLILRYCGQAMLRDDLQFLEDQLLHWLRTMLVAFQFGNNCLRDSYIWLDQRCQSRLQPASYTLLKPALQAVLQIVPEGENRE